MAGAAIARRAGGALAPQWVLYHQLVDYRSIEGRLGSRLSAVMVHALVGSEIETGKI
jgi:hypothetical protein